MITITEVESKRIEEFAKDILKGNILRDIDEEHRVGLAALMSLYVWCAMNGHLHKLSSTCVLLRLALEELE